MQAATTLLPYFYILGSCHANVEAEAPILSISEDLFTAPILSIWEDLFTARGRVEECYSIFADLNWSLSVRVILRIGRRFSRIFGSGSISSQLILPNATFLLSYFHIWFLFWVCRRNWTGRRFADGKSRLQGHSGVSKPGTFGEWRNFLRPIFSVRIWTINGCTGPLPRPLCTSSVFFEGFGQISCSPSPRFLTCPGHFSMLEGPVFQSQLDGSPRWS